MNILYRFSKKTQISNFMKIRPLEAELFHADKRTGGRANMTKKLVAFSNFTNAPKNVILFVVASLK